MSCQRYLYLNHSITEIEMSSQMILEDILLKVKVSSKLEKIKETFITKIKNELQVQEILLKRKFTCKLSKIEQDQFQRCNSQKANKSSSINWNKIEGKDEFSRNVNARTRKERYEEMEQELPESATDSTNKTSVGESGRIGLEV